ncbi:hypothetical protein [Ascidiaceihabitans sp.]|uniref:hypothetical protein n=1 Tax=Ascidiaceihabitans sp. TaxID=1872644 RepID=UPI0032986D4A
MAYQDFHDRVRKLDLPFTPRPLAIGKRTQSGLAESAKHHISFTTAMVIGVMAVVFTRFVMMAFFGVPTTASLQNMFAMLETAGAVLCVVAVRIPLKEHHKDVLASHLIGVLVTLFMMHNFVHSNPDLWVQVFGVPWVDHVLATTQAGSVQIGTISLSLL